MRHQMVLIAKHLLVSICRISGRSADMMSTVLASDEDCWVPDHFHYVICFHQHKCRSSCQDHGFVDGRCAGFPNLVPMCECLRANCPP